MYSLEKHEIDSLAAGYSSPALGLAGAFFGAAVTLLATFYSVSLPEPTATRMFIGGWSCAGLTMICSMVALQNWRKARQMKKDVTTEVIEYEVEQARATPIPKRTE
jgi:hypothetical protein